MAGEGTVFQRRDGRWVAKLSVGSRESYRQFATYHRSRTAAIAALADLRNRAGRIDPATLTVSDYLARWVRDARDIRPTTRHGYRAAIVTHIAPTIGHLRLTELSPLHVEAMLAELAPRMAPKTLRNVHVVLRRAMGQESRDADALAVANRGAVPTSLYRFFDAEDQLLYVGITSVGPSRWSEHEAHRPWWREVARTSVTHYPDRESAAIAEKAAIQLEKPQHNVTHAVPRTTRLRAHGPRGAGTIIKRPDNRYQVRIGFDGNIYQTTTRTEADARLILAALVGRNCTPAIRERAILILQAGPDWNGKLPDQRRRRSA